MHTTADLAYMRETQEQALPGTIVIERYTLTPNGMGGQYEAWSAVGTADGRISEDTNRSAGEVIGGAQVMSVTRWVATFSDRDVDVLPKDRLFYGSRTWEVIDTNNDKSWRTATRCRVQAMNEERRV